MKRDGAGRPVHIARFESAKSPGTKAGQGESLT